MLTSCRSAAPSLCRLRWPHTLSTLGVHINMYNHLQAPQTARAALFILPTLESSAAHASPTPFGALRPRQMHHARQCSRGRWGLWWELRYPCLLRRIQHLSGCHRHLQPGLHHHGRHLHAPVLQQEAGLPAAASGHVLRLCRWSWGGVGGWGRDCGRVQSCLTSARNRQWGKRRGPSQPRPGYQEEVISVVSPFHPPRLNPPRLGEDSPRGTTL